MGRNYGVSYKGSKSRIVEKLVEAIPCFGVDNFYDLFWNCFCKSWAICYIL